LIAKTCCSIARYKKIKIVDFDNCCRGFKANTDFSILFNSTGRTSEIALTLTNDDAEELNVTKIEYISAYKIKAIWCLLFYVKA